MQILEEIPYITLFTLFMTKLMKIMQKAMSMIVALATVLTISAPSIASAAYPKVSGVNVSSSSFNPSAGGSVSVTFYLDDTASISLLVGGGAITTVDFGQKTKGSNSVTWNGKNSAGSNVAPGTYALTVKARNLFGEVSTGSTSVTVTGTTSTASGSQYGTQTGGLTDSTPSGSTSGSTGGSSSYYGGSTPSGIPYISNLKAQSVTFSAGQSASVTFNLDSAASSLTVRVTGNGLSKTVYSGTGVKGYNGAYSWDGRDSSGNFVPSGTYYFTVNASNVYGSSPEKSVQVVFLNAGQGGQTGGGTTVIVVPTPTNNNAVGGNNNATTNVVGNTVDNSVNSTNTTVINNQNGTVAANTSASSNGYGYPSTTGGYYNPGSYNPGYYDPGYYQPGYMNYPDNGGYYYPYEVPQAGCYYDGVGGYSCPVAPSSGATGVPYILNDYATPNPFNPSYQQYVTINYFVNNTANVTVTIYKDGGLVKTLKSSTETGAGYAYWDGRYVDGLVVPGVYKYRINASNSYGSDVREGDITVTTYYQQNYYGAQNPYYYVPGNKYYYYGAIPCAGFSDLDVSSPYCRAVQELLKMNIFQGYTDGTFKPSQKITRAETTKVILKALKYPTLNINTLGYPYSPVNPYGLAPSYNSAYIGGFRDINFYAWYVPYVLTARAYGVISGYPDATFKPDRTVNRAELLKILVRAANVQTPYTCYQPYADTPKTAETQWYMPYACFARQYFLLDTDSKGRVKPAAQMTRGDLAMLIYRAYRQGLLKYQPPATPPYLALVKPGYGVNPIYPGVNPVYPGAVPTCTTGTFDPATGLCVINGNAVSIGGDSMTPNPYNPVGNPPAVVTYTLSAPAEVTVKILEVGTNNIVKTLKTSAFESGTNTALWDGKKFNGDYADAGISYKYSIEAKKNDKTSVKEGLITVQYTTVIY